MPQLPIMAFPVLDPQEQLAAFREALGRITEAIKMVIITEESGAEKETDIKMPEKFKISTKWIVFSETVDTYLNQLHGQGRIPLNYIIRMLEAPVPGTVYDTEQEMLIQTVPLTGDPYDLDNE
jgi:hypothetical protein